jgi:uncharacterized damage-inducible protein DinB
MNDPLIKLIRHAIWANAQLVDFLIAEHIDDPAVIKLACHLALGEAAWFQRVRDESVDPDVWKILPLPKLRILLDENHCAFDEILQSDLSRKLLYRRFNGDAAESSVADILMHLCTHGFHHRGQIAMLLSRLGKKMPNLDYINYCRLTVNA